MQKVGGEEVGREATHTLHLWYELKLYVEIHPYR